MAEAPLGEVIREFVPSSGTSAIAGRIVVRTANQGSRLERFDELFSIMAEDALQFEPPVDVKRARVEVVHFAGERYKRTFGLEFVIPAGVKVSDNYTRIVQLEDLL
jgi:hypothetical protein